MVLLGSQLSCWLLLFARIPDLLLPAQTLLGPRSSADLAHPYFSFYRFSGTFSCRITSAIFNLFFRVLSHFRPKKKSIIVVLYNSISTTFFFFQDVFLEFFYKKIYLKCSPSFS